MGHEEVLRAIDAEIGRLQQAKALLSGAKMKASRPKRRLSAKARKAISDAQKKRWATVKAGKG